MKNGVRVKEERSASERRVKYECEKSGVLAKEEQRESERTVECE